MEEKLTMTGIFLKKICLSKVDHGNNWQKFCEEKYHQASFSRQKIVLKKKAFHFRLTWFLEMSGI